MEYLYIDESGSMTNEYITKRPYFIIAVIRAVDKLKASRSHKRFVSKHFDDLKNADSANRMFDGDKFKELKGSAFSPGLKRSFAEYFGKSNSIEVFYILIDNSQADSKLYENKARAFNYVLKLALEFWIRHGYLPKDQYIIQLDERNERTETKYFLQNYLNTELRMNNLFSSDASVQYFDSQNNRLIQIADVFANLYLSELDRKSTRLNSSH